MKKKLKILIVDDHPMIVEAYKNILMSAELDTYQFKIDEAYHCDEGIEKIEKAYENNSYDIIFLDIKLPPSSDGTIISGEGLALHAKELLPGCRIVILTMFNENFRIHSILKTINPDGLLIKNDLTSDEFLRAFEFILNDPPYYSSTVAKYFRKQAVTPANSMLDDINRKIVFHISKGVTTKNLVNHIDLSLSAIEKRKIQIKRQLGIEKANDEELIQEAKKRGII